MRVFSHTSPRANILAYPNWYLQQAGSWVRYELQTGRVHGKGIVAQLKGCNERDQAAALVQAEIAVPREQLPDLQSDEFYWTDLEGLKVQTTAGVGSGCY